MIAVQVTEAQAKVVMSFTIARIGIARCQALNRLAKQLFGLNSAEDETDAAVELETAALDETD